MKLLVFCCQTRPSPIAILEQPFQGRRHTARLVKDQAQILERLRHGKMGAANVPCVRDSRRCPIEDDNFSLGGADGEAHALTETLHAINQLLQSLRRQIQRPIQEHRQTSGSLCHMKDLMAL